MITSKIRTMLIDDSAFMRRVITDIINSDESIELVGVARNGEQCVAMAEELKPDVVITDMVMPEYDGMYVVNSLMEKKPLPIILLSSLEKTDSRIFDALQHGAFDFIDKPTDFEKLKIEDYRLLELIKQASQTDITVLKARQLAKKNNNTHTFESVLRYRIVVIGASTGGPGAVEYIINNLPTNLKIPVVIVQHMPHRFLESFTARINEQSHFTVKLADKGEPVRDDVIYLAPGESNLRIDHNLVTGKPMFTFTDRKYSEFNNPSVDCLFESVADIYGNAVIGVVLTGMGRDGTAGLSKIKDKGGYTIVQDEESCVVYGMPKSAFEAGAAKQKVSLKQIPGFIVSCL